MLPPVQQAVIKLTFNSRWDTDHLLSYTAIGRHIYKRLKMCKQYAKEMATLQ